MGSSDVRRSENVEHASVLLGRKDRTREQVEALFDGASEDYWRTTFPTIVEAALTEHGWHPDHIRMAAAGPSLALQLLRTAHSGSTLES